MRITKSACTELAKSAPESGVPTYWDDELKGFGVRHIAKGHLTFVLKYRVKGNPKQRWLKLGTFPAMLPDKARDEAKQIKTEADLGRDLVATREAAERATREAEERAAREAEAARAEAARRGYPVADLLDAWRSLIDADITKKGEIGRPAGYERELLRLESVILRPAIGHLPVGDLDPERLQALINLHAERSPSTARNLRSLIARFAAHANDRAALAGIPLKLPTSYTLKLRGKIRSRDHYYTVDEAASLWVAAGSMGRRGALVRFILLTACRRIEAQLVEWDHIVFDDPVVGPYWQQPAHLTKTYSPHRVPLSPPAVALLRWLPPRKSKSFGEAKLIFAGEGNRPVGGWTDIRRKVLELAGVGDGTLHDIRRTVVSTLGDRGFDPQVVDTLLNHAAATTMGGVMGVYQRSDFWAQRRRAIEAWSDLLMERVHARMQVPLCRETWGFTAPFKDVRLKRPPPAPAGSAPTSGSAPGPATPAGKPGRRPRKAA